eukprot:gene57058-biopygen84319
MAWAIGLLAIWSATLLSPSNGFTQVFHVASEQFNRNGTDHPLWLHYQTRCYNCTQFNGTAIDASGTIFQISGINACQLTPSARFPTSNTTFVSDIYGKHQAFAYCGKSNVSGVCPDLHDLHPTDFPSCGLPSPAMDAKLRLRLWGLVSTSCVLGLLWEYR